MEVRRPHLASLLALGVALASCAGGTALQRSATLPQAARSEPQHYVVVTVRNPYAALPAHAASTGRGYDGAGPYLAGAAARSEAHAVARAYRLEEVSSWPIALLGVHCLVYGIAAGEDPARVIAALAKDARVESVQALQAFATATTEYNDPYAGLQRNIGLMSIAAAHALSRGAGVRVAVIDTGADISHPDLRPGTIARNFVDNDAATFRADPHGTAVAGIIAAVPNNGVGIVGVAPDVDLLSYKACWRTTPSATAAVCNTFTLAQALAAAIEARADIINLSLAGPSDPLLTRLVRRGLDAGAIIVGAVPPAPAQREFPADIPGVIAVDAVESGGRDAATVRVPGHDILSLTPSGHYDFFSGSSLAAAEVSGLAALLRAGHPHLAGPDVAALLTGSVDSGSGVPDACAALTKLLHRGDCQTPGGR
jgi:subtilisin family serine protease